MLWIIQNSQVSGLRVKMFKKVLLLIFVILSVVAVCNGASQFNLKFENSTSKVIVTDHYYMLDYSIVRGRTDGFCENIEWQLLIQLQMIGKFNQSRWELGRAGI